MVRRDVMRLVTPGTITEDALLDPARATAFAAVARLRAALAPHTDGASVIVTEGAGYRLAVDPAQVDAERFLRLADLGPAAPAPTGPPGVRLPAFLPGAAVLVAARGEKDEAKRKELY